MARKTSPLSWLLLISLACSLFICCRGASEDDRKVYIAYMGDLPKGDFSASSFHTGMLQEVVGSRAADSLLYSYKRSFNGFVAKLTKAEAEKLAGMEGVVSVFPSQKKDLHTTRSWHFMGFPQNVHRAPIESDVIIGMLDTGIWPESYSFSDVGLSAPPSKWKGSCQASSNFTCNNKIIGAKYYRADGEFGPHDYPSPRDSEGHGSHTASTAAGALVSNASMLGLGMGTARGGVPSARIAVYKICWSDGCYDADILAAFDDAIADGVDVISLSVGGWPTDYFEDVIAIGAFHSMKNGILTSNSAGNDGPEPASISNVSPWSLSVAASTIDRKFVTKVPLGNNMVYEGISLNTFELKNDFYPIIYAGDAPNTTAGYDGSQSRYCDPGTLNATLVNGKIVLCDVLNEGSAAYEAGAVGVVMRDSINYRDVTFAFILPASFLTWEDGIHVSEYMNSSSYPVATILKSNEAVDELAPAVVSFSSRGPNPITSDLLKPDLTAPGVDILAAWSLATTVTGAPEDNRVVPYNIISGTSMSCPHASGAAAYVKSFHPTWTPAAIKSALMTTAYPMSVETNTDAEFAYGAGHINPVKAVTPGLVYDAGEADYVKFLCGIGYNNKSLRLVTGDNSSSCTETTNGTVWDLNYPSFALSTTSNIFVTRVFHRTVTNVGSPVSTYTAIVNAPSALKIQVEPSVLTFNSLGQKQSFVVTVEATVHKEVHSGSLVWDDGLYQVRSPIVAFLSQHYN